MALRSSSPANPVEPTADSNGTLNSAPNQRALPESREKRVTAVVLAVIIVGAMFLPWWKTTGELLQHTTELTGFDLLIVGFGMGGYAPLTGFSVIGNILFGALTTVPLLVVAALLVIRAVKPRALPASTVALWALLAILTLSWLFVVGWARLNATLGIFPVTWGVLIEAMAMAFTAVAMWNWWRRGERGLWPKRSRFQLRNKQLEDAEPTTVGALFDDGEDADADSRAREDADDRVDAHGRADAQSRDDADNDSLENAESETEPDSPAEGDTDSQKSR
ncbi:MAG: hypothetical protein ACTHXA_14990 [Gulosibacter sp.]|uniref:hypothetical protein n=1 Tax=Gulosibacter sp. TaxID=2817531 RepID=UPI003F92FF1D